MSDTKELTTPIDRVSKLLFKEYSDLLLKLTFPGQMVHVIGVEENVEINLPTKSVDMVMTLLSQEGGASKKFGLHIEYYASYKKEIPQTVFIYSAELTDRMKMEVASVVIYTDRRTPEARPEPQYEVKVNGNVINCFTYTDIWLMDYEKQIRSGELAPLAPFLLEIVSEPDIETLETARTLALSEPDEEKRCLLISFVTLLAGRYFDKETIKKMFQMEADMVKTNTFIDDWLEEAEERGKKKGLQEGVLKTQQRLLLRLLERRFGPLSVDFILSIQDLPLDKLDRLFELGLDATELADVEQAIPQLA